MRSLQGRALESNQMQSHTGGGAQREENSGTPMALGPGFWLGQQDPVSRAGKGTRPFARSCRAISLLSLHQELALPTASRDRAGSAGSEAYLYTGPSSGHPKHWIYCT